jgi:hypothetical protein
VTFIDPYSCLLWRILGGFILEFIGRDISGMLFVSLFEITTHLTYTREVTGLALYLVNSNGLVSFGEMCSDVEFVTNHIICT